jgi:predicted small integral membrane protein
MAWTWQTAVFFGFVFGCVALMAVLEWLHPGGNPRKGILGLETTRGDRLFVSLLGAAYILLAWLGLWSTPLWGGLAVAAAWTAFVFWKV